MLLTHEKQRSNAFQKPSIIKTIDNCPTHMFFIRLCILQKHSIDDDKTARKSFSGEVICAAFPPILLNSNIKFMIPLKTIA